MKFFGIFLFRWLSVKFCVRLFFVDKILLWEYNMYNEWR